MNLITPTFTTTGKYNQTFNFYLLSTTVYENEITLTSEKELIYFQDELVEMEGYCGDITKDNELTMFQNYNLSSEKIEEIKEQYCLIITQV